MCKLCTVMLKPVGLKLQSNWPSDHTDLQHAIVHDAPLNVCDLGSSQAQRLYWRGSSRDLELSTLSWHMGSPWFQVTADQVKEEPLVLGGGHPGSQSADVLMDDSPVCSKEGGWHHQSAVCRNCIRTQRILLGLVCGSWCLCVRCLRSNPGKLILEQLSQHQVEMRTPEQEQMRPLPPEPDVVTVGTECQQKLRQVTACKQDEVRQIYRGFKNVVQWLNWDVVI